MSHSRHTMERNFLARKASTNAQANDLLRNLSFRNKWDISTTRYVTVCHCKTARLVRSAEFRNVRHGQHFAGTFADAQLWIEIKVPTVGNGLRDTNIINLDSLVIFITVYTMRSGLINDQLVFLSRRLTRYVTRKSTITELIKVVELL